MEMKGEGEGEGEAKGRRQAQEKEKRAGFEGLAEKGENCQETSGCAAGVM